MICPYLTILHTDDEKEQFSAIYESYLRLVYFVAQDILHNKEQAEDATQDVFCYLAENFDAIPKEPHKLRSYLYLCAKTKAIDKIRKAKHESSQSDDVIDAVAPCQPNIADDMIALSGVNEILHCLNKLPDLYRVPMILHVQGFSDLHISNMLGINPATVRKRLERGRKKIWEGIKENEF